LLGIELKKGNKEKIIKRKVANLIDVLASVGGIITIIQLSCGIILASYVESKYYDSILQILFKQQNDLISKKEKKKIKASSKLKGEKDHLHSRLLTSIINRIPA